MNEYTRIESMKANGNRESDKHAKTRHTIAEENCWKSECDGRQTWMKNFNENSTAWLTLMMLMMMKNRTKSCVKYAERLDSMFSTSNKCIRDIAKKNRLATFVSFVLEFHLIKIKAKDPENWSKWVWSCGGIHTSERIARIDLWIRRSPSSASNESVELFRRFKGKFYCCIDVLGRINNVCVRSARS